jgi:hypothetical protein
METPDLPSFHGVRSYAGTIWASALSKRPSHGGLASLDAGPALHTKLEKIDFDCICKKTP